MTAPTRTFPKFLELPLELQMQVWEHTIAASEPRIISITETREVYPFHDLTMKVEQSYSVLFSTCSTARKVALQTYGARSRQAEEGSESSSSDRHNNAAEIQVCHTRWNLTTNDKGIRVPYEIINEYNRHIHDHHITHYKYMGNHGYFHDDDFGDPDVQKKSKEPRERGDGSKSSAGTTGCRTNATVPIWYEPTRDVLLFKNRDFIYQYAFRLSDSERKPHNSQVKHVAFYCNSHRWSMHPPSMNTRIVDGKHLMRWLGLARKPLKSQFGSAAEDNQFHRKDYLSHLDSMSLLFPHKREVVVLSLDESGTLQPGEWSYQLDTDSQRFEREMGQSWAGVTWRVFFGKQEGCGLHELTRHWRPDVRKWAKQQQIICADVLDDGNIWLDIGTYPEVVASTINNAQRQGKLELLGIYGGRQTYRGFNEDMSV